MTYSVLTQVRGEDACGATNQAKFFDLPVLPGSNSYFLYGVLAECCQQGISAEICIIQINLICFSKNGIYCKLLSLWRGDIVLQVFPKEPSKQTNTIFCYISPRTNTGLINWIITCWNSPTSRSRYSLRDTERAGKSNAKPKYYHHQQYATQYRKIKE